MSERNGLAPASLDSLNLGIRRFSEGRRRPLLVMYYPEIYGHIDDSDVKDLYDEFRENGVSRESQLENLDVMIHTLGGSPNAIFSANEPSTR